MGALSEMANKGRNGDTELSHLSEGEVVVPREFWELEPDLMRDIMNRIAATGADPREVIAGMGRVNPETGLEEFATAEEIQNYYLTYLGRPVESQEMLDWQVANTQGMTSDQVAQGFMATPERATYVENLYNTYLGRTPESQDVIQYHTGSGLSAEDLTNAFANSEERQLQQTLGYVAPDELYTWTGGPATESDLNNIYMTSFGRPGEEAGLDYWSDATQGLSGSDYMTRAMRAGAQGDDLLALRDPTLPTYGMDRYNQAWDPLYNINDPTMDYYYDQEVDKWSPRTQAVQQQPPSTGSAGFNNQTIPPSPFGNVAHSIPTFNTGLESPFSGANWRNTITSGTGYSGQSAYDFIKAKAGSGNSTLSSLQSDLGLNPGEIMAIYEEAVKYAQANGLATPLMPAVTSANKPYYRYGFNPAQNLYNRNVGGQDVTNPIAAYLSQIQSQRAAETPTVALAEGGSAKRGGGLTSIKNDPVIHKYLKRGGQTDNVPAMLSEGEYVIDADVVAALGDGNNGEGARKLDRMRENVRKHKRGASVKNIPPRAKEPEQYLKGK